MTEPEDLLSKADALMARHRPGHGASTAYAEIPVLEEVVVLPAESDGLPLLTEMVGFDQIALEPSAPEPMRDQHAEALAASMRAALLAALQPAIDTLVEERLKECLAPRVERLFNELRDDLQLRARDALSTAIHAAVERELERRKADN
jgi:hypothetical protein